LSDNIKKYKQGVIHRMKTLKKKKENKEMIQKIYNEIDIEISRLIKQRHYYKEFTKLNITQDVFVGKKPTLENVEQNEEETVSDYQERTDIIQRNYQTALKRWNIHNEKYVKTYHDQKTLHTLFDTIKSRIKAKCNLYILNEKFVTIDQLEMFLDYISDHAYDITKNSDRLYLINEIVDILYSRFDTIYYKNLFFDDISTTSYENFCKLQKTGQTTAYCSEQSLQFLKEYYTYNNLHIYDSYQHNISTNLSKNDLQLIDMITKSKKNKNHELLTDIYKNIQIEKELVNIETSYNRIVTDTDSSISVEELLEKNKREFMLIRDSFNDEIKKNIYYDACYGFKIVKVYKKQYDLLSDNMSEVVYYDEIFDTTERDIDIINEYTHMNSIDIEDIDRPDTMAQLYTIFNKYYIFSPEYEIKNIVHNAVENIKKMDISPVKNSKGKIIINKMSDIRNRILWSGHYFSLDVDGTMKVEDSDSMFNINDMTHESDTQITTNGGDIIDINRIKLLSYFDMLNIIHINKKNIRRPIIDGEYAILKTNQQRNIYKRTNSKWVVLNKEKVSTEGTCLLNKYKFKQILSLEFDDLLLLNENMINEIEANPNVDLVEKETTPLQQVKDLNIPSEQQDSSPELSGDVPIKKVLEAIKEEDTTESVEGVTIDTMSGDTGIEESLNENGDVKEGEEGEEGEGAGDPSSKIVVIKESSDNMAGGNIFNDDLINLFGISENVINDMYGGATVDEPVSKPVVEEVFNGFNTCINTDFLPIEVQKLFTYPDENITHDIQDVNITVPKEIIKFIFRINKKFNLIKEMDHVIVDKQDLLTLLKKQNKHIRGSLRSMKRIHEEQKIHNKTEIAKKLSKIKKINVPKYILQEFYSIFLIQDMDIGLSTLKDFIEKYGIYNKPEIVMGEDSDTPDRIKCIDPELDPATSKFIYWDPYFFPGVNESMCCKHYIDLTHIAWLDNNSRNSLIENIAHKYAQKDHVEGGHMICKHCGEYINYIKYSDQEGFGSEDKPIVFREKVDDNEYDDLLVSSEYNSQFFSKKILLRFLKKFNLNVTPEDTLFIEQKSFKTYKLYEKTQKEIYMIFVHELVKGKHIIDIDAVKNCKLFYSKLIQNNPALDQFFITNDISKQKKQKKQYLNMFIGKYYKKNKKDKGLTIQHKQFLKFSDAILKQTKRYNTTIQIYTTMIYLIFIILYSQTHYKIISSGDARYTGQRVIIYDTEESLKLKCIDVALEEKKTTSKNSVWKKFVHNEELFETIYTTIYKYPDIQTLKQDKITYNTLLEQKSETIQQTLEWNTFRPTLVPDYNYTNTTSMDQLQTLVNELQGTTSNVKKYKLLSHISEETRKLSLEHISKINNFIILHKQIKHLNFVSYQSSCCDFNIHNTYQGTLSKELNARTNDITILYDNLKQSDTDYYLLHGFKGINDKEKGRTLLNYLDMKTTLYNEYSSRQETESYHITDKDAEYKSYLENKIYTINHYAVVEDIFDSEYVGYKRLFIDVIDPDYQLLSELEIEDDLETALHEALTRKYKGVQELFHITNDSIDNSAFETFIQRKITIIMEHDGETQKDLTTGMYVYEINSTIHAYIEDKTIIELKELTDLLENYLEKKIKTKLIINTNKSQQNKIYSKKRSEEEHIHNQLSIIKKISHTFTSLDTNNELFINDTLFTSLYGLYNSISETDEDEEYETDNLVEYKIDIRNIIINIIDMYDSFEVSDIPIHSSVQAFKNIYITNTDLINMLGMNSDLEKEIYKVIENDLIVQGYKKNSTTYNNELIFRKRNVSVNLESDRIITYKESIKYILNIYSKLNHFIYKDFTIEEKNISKEETVIRDMFKEHSNINVKSTFINTHIQTIYTLLDIITPKRNIYDVSNNIYIKSAYNVQVMNVLIKYIFVKVLESFMEIGYGLSGIQKTNAETLKKLVLSNISNINIQLKNTDEIIQDQIIAYQKKQNDDRKIKFERMVNYDRENASIYLISRTINMGNIFTKRNEQNEALYTVNEEGAMAAFVSQTLEEGGPLVATTEDMEQFEQNQADTEAAQEFGMDNVLDEDEE